MDLALRFRQKFGQDVIVDIICYRRLGHNEADEPSFSHPKMYSHIKTHKTARELYGQRLIDEGIWSIEEQRAFSKDYTKELKQHLTDARGGYEPNMNDAYQGDVWKDFSRTYSFESVNTRVDLQRLTHIARKLVTIPEQFNVHPKLRRFTQGREKTVLQRGFSRLGLCGKFSLWQPPPGRPCHQAQRRRLCAGDLFPAPCRVVGC